MLNSYTEISDSLAGHQQVSQPIKRIENRNFDFSNTFVQIVQNKLAFQTKMILVLCTWAEIACFVKGTPLQQKTSLDFSKKKFWETR